MWFSHALFKLPMSPGNRQYSLWPRTFPNLVFLHSRLKVDNHTKVHNINMNEAPWSLATQVWQDLDKKTWCDNLVGCGGRCAHTCIHVCLRVGLLTSSWFRYSFQSPRINKGTDLGAICQKLCCMIMRNWAAHTKPNIYLNSIMNKKKLDTLQNSSHDSRVLENAVKPKNNAF